MQRSFSSLLFALTLGGSAVAIAQPNPTSGGGVAVSVQVETHPGEYLSD